jgi:hypothetical protein
MKNNGILLIILGVSLIVMGFVIGISDFGKKEVEPIIKEKIIYSELSEWDIFVMALVEVECGRNPLARSNKNAIGPFQITPIYVKEVNRLYGTKYTFEDAWDIQKAYEMFMLMNRHYNPTFDIDKAIKLHNPGAGAWYEKRIKQQMKLIIFNESVRKIITKNTIKN